ncbi:hypothetical protein CMUS01_16623 [Colletotrichum musicola]|uniref:Uncharacterized protein n=1 Tax=Colletotrichum musicola TaxID=2175873 RepID=A0A8H6ILP7_9PEZI|nr:hypothetical protein CMUS01_16623 [Colletotrichum musicola]
MLAIQLLALVAPVVLAKARTVLWYNSTSIYNHYVSPKGFLRPDGPWYALITCHERYTGYVCAPVWPTGSLDTIMPSLNGAGGVYEGQRIENVSNKAWAETGSVQYQWPNVRPNVWFDDTLDDDVKPAWYMNNMMELAWPDEETKWGRVNASVREVFSWSTPYVDTTPVEDPEQ